MHREVVVAKNATTSQQGALSGKTQTHNVNHYNLDAIISVGKHNPEKNLEWSNICTSRLINYVYPKTDDDT